MPKIIEYKDCMFINFFYVEAEVNCLWNVIGQNFNFISIGVWIIFTIFQLKSEKLKIKYLYSKDIISDYFCCCKKRVNKWGWSENNIVSNSRYIVITHSFCCLNLTFQYGELQ